MFGAMFVWAYATLVRRLVGDWRIALIAAIALAYSGGIAMHIAGEFPGLALEFWAIRG